MRTYWKVQFCKAFKCKLDYAKLPFLYGSLKDPFQTVWLTHGIIDNLTDFAPRQFKFSVSPNDLSFRYEVDDFYDFVALCLLLYLKNPVYSKLTICPICGRAITKKDLTLYVAALNTLLLLVKSKLISSLAKRTHFLRFGHGPGNAQIRWLMCTIGKKFTTSGIQKGSCFTQRQKK